jgi:endonuclease/exonuclease/phosphatase family metal-dependent hydrolase
MHRDRTLWEFSVTDLPPFRVVTLNLLHDPPHHTWLRRAPLVEAGLIALQPDIVLLQEVAWPNEQATDLAAALQMNSGDEYRMHITGLFTPTGWQEGLAILARLPFLGTSQLAFPRAETFCHRVRLDIGGNMIDVYNSHLDPYSADRRAQQITMAMTWMRESHGADAIVFGGDLNGTPNSAEIAPLSATLHSALASVHGEDPERMVDYLWMSSSLTVTAAEFALDQPAAGDPSLYPSDHPALYADVTQNSGD